MKFSEKVGNGPTNKCVNFGGDPDHRLDTGIVFRTSHCWEIQKLVVSTDRAAQRCSLDHALWHCHSNYGVITSSAYDRQRNWYRDTGKTCLGGGMHCTVLLVRLSNGA